MDAAVDRLEVKIVQASGLKSTESGAPSAYAEVSTLGAVQELLGGVRVRRIESFCYEQQKESTRRNKKENKSDKKKEIEKETEIETEVEQRLVT